jgi:hypothetical protein
LRQWSHCRISRWYLGPPPQVISERRRSTASFAGRDCPISTTHIDERRRARPVVAVSVPLPDASSSAETHFSAVIAPRREMADTRCPGARINGAPKGIRTPDPLLRSCAIQNSKCRFWCRARGSASFISLLNWTEVGLKFLGVMRWVISTGQQSPGKFRRLRARGENRLVSSNRARATQIFLGERVPRALQPCEM